MFVVTRERAGIGGEEGEDELLEEEERENMERRLRFGGFFGNFCTGTRFVICDGEPLVAGSFLSYPGFHRERSVETG